MSKIIIASSFLILFGYVGLLLNKRNFIFFLVYLELVYNGIMVNILFIGYHLYSVSAGVYFLIVLAVVSAEAVVGLVLAVLYFRTTATLDLDNLSTLNG